MPTFDLTTIDPRQAYGYLTSVIGPRPIAFVSSINARGMINLSAFSYFNMVSALPPMVIFSVSNPVLRQTPKDTLANVREVPEVVINLVNRDIVDQMNLASSYFPPEVNEFEMSMLTPIDSLCVSPPRVEESLVQLECSVEEVKSLGDQPGAGNLVICRVLMLHAREHVFADNGSIDPSRMDMVARLGGDFYTHVSGKSLFELPHPAQTAAMGASVVSEILGPKSGLNKVELSRLGLAETVPNKKEIEEFTRSDAYRLLQDNAHKSGHDLPVFLVQSAKAALEGFDIDLAWRALLSAQLIESQR